MVNVIDPNAQYSILGTSIRLDRVEGETLVLHAPLRLGPGRTVPIRCGATTFKAMVLNARVFALHGEEGTTYEIEAEMTGEPIDGRSKASASLTASPACLADAPKERRPAVELAASKKGGRSRAA